MMRIRALVRAQVRPAVVARPTRVRASLPAGEPVAFSADDGVVLGGRWFASSTLPCARVVLAPATGVPQRFYAGFAAWLAQQGCSTLTFDYRGIGASRSGGLRGLRADFSHWSQDIDAAIAALHQRGEGRVLLLGHSIGGFLAPLAERATTLDRLVLVGAQTAYWRDWPRRLRWPMTLLWHGAMPLATLAWGYFPAKAFRLGEDLPRGVALQWAGRPWRDPFDDAECVRLYGRALPPVHLVAASDDVFATAAAQARVRERLTGTAVRVRAIEPATVGLPRLGHFDLFRNDAGTRVWTELLRELQG